MEIALSAKQMLWQRKVEYRRIYVCGWISCVVGVGNLCVCVCVCVWSNWLQMSSTTCGHYTKLLKEVGILATMTSCLCTVGKKRKEKEMSHLGLIDWFERPVRTVCTWWITHESRFEVVQPGLMTEFAESELVESKCRETMTTCGIVRQWLHVGLWDNDYMWGWKTWT